MANGITPFTPLRTKLSWYLYYLTPPYLDDAVKKRGVSKVNPQQLFASTLSARIMMLAGLRLRWTMPDSAPRAGLRPPDGLFRDSARRKKDAAATRAASRPPPTPSPYSRRRMAATQRRRACRCAGDSVPRQREPHARIAR